MTIVTNIRISDQKAKRLVATAPSGEYLTSPGHDSELLAVQLALQSGQSLQQKKLYAVAGSGLPASLNFEYLHTSGDPPNEIWVFEEVTS